MIKPFSISILSIYNKSSIQFHSDAFHTLESIERRIENALLSASTEFTQLDKKRKNYIPSADFDIFSLFFFRILKHETQRFLFKQKQNKNQHLFSTYKYVKQNSWITVNGRKRRRRRNQHNISITFAIEKKKRRTDISTQHMQAQRIQCVKSNKTLWIK